ncbi:hypothetical protein LJC60_00955 [Ruminococcaceae bacterium OttesenSCG-928-D13]|nr:hypothetical protein [Ruminococcaceae bacterium OttesenSCG-928-D13]
MTLEDIEMIDREVLYAEDVCEYLGANPDVIRWQAHNGPEKLGFPVIVVGRRVKIPKIGFVNYCRHGRVVMMVGEPDFAGSPP